MGYKKVYEDYKDALIKGNANHSLRMVFVDKQFWKDILLIMLATRKDIDAFDKFLTDVLKVKQDDDVKIKIAIDRKKLDRWQPNPSSFYMRTIADNILPDGSIAIEKLNEAQALASELFNHFVNAKDAIDGISISMNGCDSSYLSEGEKKMMVIEFILEAIADENTLVLMDEPDSHIHVSRKMELKDYFCATDNRENIITSHSPSLTSAFDRESVIMLSNENGMAKIVDPKNRDIVERLTNGIWSAMEQNIFLCSNKDILMLEGPSDLSYVKAALKSFHDNNEYKDMDFDYIPCGGAEQVGRLKESFVAKEGQSVIAIWDYDGAGIEAMSKVLNIDKSALPRARKEKNIWFAL